MDALIGFDKPIIAAVQGAAIGGGTTMLMHCDFVYAGESAKFQMPFVNLGLVPEFGSSFSVPARTGHLRAAELILLGEPFTATRAAELGLVTRVVPERELLATATATAQKLAAKAISALRVSKRLIKQASIGPLREAMKIENQEFIERLGSAESSRKRCRRSSRSVHPISLTLRRTSPPNRSVPASTRPRQCRHMKTEREQRGKPAPCGGSLLSVCRPNGARSKPWDTNATCGPAGEPWKPHSRSSWAT